jgi:hypothetical protein
MSLSNYNRDIWESKCVLKENKEKTTSPDRREKRIKEKAP